MSETTLEAPLAPISFGRDGVFAFDDVDLTDPTLLRRLVGEVELYLGVRHGLRLSLLTEEEWSKVLAGSLSPSLRRGAARHIHVLRDRRDPKHLFVSPSAVAGVNEGDRVIYAEIVFCILRCLPTDMNTTLRRGLDGLLAGWIGKHLGVNIYNRSFGVESELVLLLLRELARQYGHTEVEWGRLLRRQPQRVFLALSRSRFARTWLSAARNDEQLKPLLSDPPARDDLGRLLAGQFSSEEPVFTLTLETARRFRDEQEATS